MRRWSVQAAAVLLAASTTGCANGSGALVYEGGDALGPFRRELSAGNCFTNLKGTTLEGIFHVGYGRLDFHAEPVDGATPSFDAPLSTWRLRVTEVRVYDGARQWDLKPTVCALLDTQVWVDSDNHVHVSLKVDCHEPKVDDSHIRGRVWSDSCDVFRP